MEIVSSKPYMEVDKDVIRNMKKSRCGGNYFGTFSSRHLGRQNNINHFGNNFDKLKKKPG